VIGTGVIMNLNSNLHSSFIDKWYIILYLINYIYYAYMFRPINKHFQVNSRCFVILNLAIMNLLY
jgi:hypothetical protein